MYSIRDIRKYTGLVIKSSQLNINNNDQIKNFIIGNINNLKITNNFDWNYFVFYKNNNIDIELKLNSDDKFDIYINKIHIKTLRKEKYFYFEFIKQIKKKKLFKDYFDENDILLDDKIMIEKYTCEKQCRVDIKIYINENNYFVIEFFEEYHFNKNDLEFESEKNRLHKILYDNSDENKILFVGIFWNKNLDEKNKLKTFVNKIYEKYQLFKNINDKRKFCIQGINKFIGNKILAKLLYDSYENKSKPIIDINEINEIIKFKNEESKNEYFKSFLDDIEELINLKNLKNYNNLNNDLSILNLDENDDTLYDITPNRDEIYYKNNKLTFSGFVRYIRIVKKYLINITEEERLLKVYENLTNGFISGLNDRYNILKNLQDERIIGLYNL